MTAQLESSIVRIRSADGKVVGAGFLVAERHVLTCAHVVAAALDLPDSTSEIPQADVRLDFPLVAAQRILTARVVLWQPPQRDGSGDIAGLELTGDLPLGTQPVRLVTADDLWGHALRAFGFPHGFDEGVWASGVLRGRTAAGWMQIEDVKATGYFVAPGFSGGPVWDEQLQGVVGMAVAADTQPGVKAAFIIPADVSEFSPYIVPPQQPLESFPLNTIPEPAPLPPGSYMPLSPNPLFVGRGADLRVLAAAFKASDTAAIGQVKTAAVTGLGGIGKTQLASEFVHRYGQYFASGVFWLSFAHPEEVPTQVAACGGPGGLALYTDASRLGLEERVAMVFSVWQNPLPRLLVFDNCEDPELLAQWRPRTGGCRVLVTSRRAEWEATLGVKVLPLGMLMRAESVALLRKHCPDADEAVLNAIAEELGDLPLALHLAGSYLARYQRATSPAAYLAKLRDPTLLRHRSLQGGGISPTGHLQHVGRTFALSYDQLDAANATDVLALALLARAAYFAPGEPIPYDLLVLSLNLPEDDPDAALQAEDALTRLIELGLLKIETDGALWLHRLVAAFLRDMAPTENEAQQAVEDAILQEISSRIDQTGRVVMLPLLERHLRAVTDAAQKREDRQAAELCDWLGYYLRNEAGDYAAARLYLERALVIWTALRTDVPNTDTLANSLAEWRWFEALNASTLANDAPSRSGLAEWRWLVALNALAVLLGDQGDHDAAKSNYEIALAFCESRLGPKHPFTATILNNLACVLRGRGDYAAARPYFEQALAINEEVLDSNHPSTANVLKNLAILLQRQGDFATARIYIERALAIYEELGSNHLFTAAPLTFLAELFQAQGDYDAARRYFERALAIHEEVLGPNHIGTAQGLINLVRLFQAQGDNAAAEPYLERALAFRIEVPKSNDRRVAVYLDDLALLLQAQGDFAAARLCFERALAIQEEALGSNHPDTAISLNNLAGLLQVQGDHNGARPYYERALAIREAWLGSEHPHTQLVRDNLAALDAPSNT